MQQTEAQRRYGIRRTMANRLYRAGFHTSAEAVKIGNVQVPGAEISNRKESK